MTAPTTIAGTLRPIDRSHDEFSDVCVIDAGRTTMRLTLIGLDAAHTVRTQKRTSPDAAFVDQITYSSDQNAIAISVVPGEEWRLVKVSQQSSRDIRYDLDATST